MLQDDDIVRITVKQTIVSEDIFNVFFYLVEVLVTGATLLDLLTDFRDSVWTVLQGLQSEDLTSLTAVAENLTNGIDVDTLTLNSGGLDLAAGPILPSYVAAGYRLNVIDKTTRPGAKRIAGIGETRVSFNLYSPNGAASVLAVAALATTFAYTGTPTGSGDAVPIVVGRDTFGAVDLTRFSRVSSVTELTTIRSQVSRRIPTV